MMIPYKFWLYGGVIWIGVWLSLTLACLCTNQLWLAGINGLFLAESTWDLYKMWITRPQEWYKDL